MTNEERIEQLTAQLTEARKSIIALAAFQQSASALLQEADATQTDGYRVPILLGTINRLRRSLAQSLEMK
jgi:hypothetical protein